MPGWSQFLAISTGVVLAAAALGVYVGQSETKSRRKRKDKEKKGVEQVETLSVDNIMEEGRECFKQGQFQAALKCFQDVILVDRMNVFAYLNSARCYFKMNQFDQCLEMTAIAKDLDPEKQEAHHISAMALFELERYEEAKVGLLKALALATTNARATNIKQKIALCNSKIAKKQSKEVKKQTVQSAVPVETEEPVAETNSVKEEHGEESEKKGESQKEEESVLDAAVPAETKVQFDQMLTQLVKIVGDKEMSKWKAQFDVVLQTLRPIPKFENQEALQAVFHELFLTLEKTEAEKWKAVFSQSLEKIQSMPDAPSSPSAMKHKYEQVLHQLQDFTSAAETAKWKQEFSGVVSELENIVRGSTSTELKSHFKQVLEQLISSVNAPETAKWRSEFNKSLAELSKSSSTLSDSVVLVDKMDNLMSSAIFVDHQVNYRDLFETVLVELSASSQKQE